jgi:hypothetical protein
MAHNIVKKLMTITYVVCKQSSGSLLLSLWQHFSIRTNHTDRLIHNASKLEQKWFIYRIPIG